MGEADGCGALDGPGGRDAAGAPEGAVTGGLGVRIDRWDGVRSAPRLAAELLGVQTRRYRHVRGVAAAARRARETVPAGDADLLVAAAWLHDIGYAPRIALTGFHPLDGARYLRGIGAPPRLCGLVANHSGAAVEAQGRGLLVDLVREYPAEESAVADALTYADLTTGPDGDAVTVAARIAEVLTRYPRGHVVHTSVSVAAPLLVATVARVEGRIAAAGAARR